MSASALAPPGRSSRDRGGHLLRFGTRPTQRPAARRAAASPRACGSRDEGARWSACRVRRNRPAANASAIGRARDHADSGRGSEDLLTAVIYVLDSPAFDTELHCASFSSETRNALAAGLAPSRSWPCISPIPGLAQRSNRTKASVRSGAEPVRIATIPSSPMRSPAARRARGERDRPKGRAFPAQARCGGGATPRDAQRRHRRALPERR